MDSELVKDVSLDNATDETVPKKKKSKKKNKGEVETLIVASEDAPHPLVDAEIVVEDAVIVEAGELVAAEESTAETVETPAKDPNKISDRTEIKQALEAAVFAAPKAISLVKLRNLLNHFNYDTSELSDILSEMIVESEAKGFQLIKVGGSYQYRTNARQADVLQKLLEDKPTRLSQSALEVLAIVAYKQPLTRTEVDTIRGTDSGHLMKGLLEKDLVRTAGHAETPGRPLLYETTPYFLEVFTMGSLDELPQMEEFNRELQDGSDDLLAAEGSDMAVLSADPGFFDRDSPLAANPDRGDFDAPTEEAVEVADFGQPTENV